MEVVYAPLLLLPIRPFNQYRFHHSSCSTQEPESLLSSRFDCFYSHLRDRSLVRFNYLRFQGVCSFWSKQESESSSTGLPLGADFFEYMVQSEIGICS